MFDVRSAIRAVVGYVFVMMLIVGASVAQINQAETDVFIQQNVFASVHQALNDAADRTLMATLAQRSWMKESTEGEALTASVPKTDPVTGVRAGVKRVDQLRPTIEPILREEGVPTELSAVVLVESGGLPTALSPKGARGVWQFMPDTARRYGLVVSAATDERLDIAKSTRAAARYLRDLHQQFGDWQLAFAAYNAGERAVDRALTRVGQRDFAAIANTLPQETRDYVPAVLQAVSIFGGSLDRPNRSSHSNAVGRVLFASGAESD